MAPPAGLCQECRHAHVVTSARGSVFSRCLLHDSDPRFPKYPRLPVTQCSGFAAQAAAQSRTCKSGSESKK
jgi:hypothetical protein